MCAKSALALKARELKQLGLSLVMAGERVAPTRVYMHACMHTFPEKARETVIRLHVVECKFCLWLKHRFEMILEKNILL